MATDLAEMKESQGAAKKPKQDFPAMLTKFLPEIQRALPKHLNADRMSRIALTAFRRTPKLGQCDPRSVFAAVIQASQLGLEPDTLGRSYLIPYGNECQFVPGWKGLVDLMNRSGQASVWTGAVFDGDEFDYQLGSKPFVRHRPKGETDPDKLLYVYAVGKVKGAEMEVIEVWPVARVEKHRNRYNKVGKRHYSYENWEMYGRKVVLLQVLKYMPCSPELATAMALNDAAETNSQKLSVQDALEGTWTPVDDDKGGDDATDAGAGGEGGEPAVEKRPSATKSATSAQGAAPGTVASPQGAAPNFMEMTAAQYADKINKAETLTRVEEIVDIARSRKDLTPEDVAFVNNAAKLWQEFRAQPKAARRQSLD